MTRYANVTADTAVIHHSGRGLRLPAGRYEVAALDGTDGELFLVQANPHDEHITIEEN